MKISAFATVTSATERRTEWPIFCLTRASHYSLHAPDKPTAVSFQLADSSKHPPAGELTGEGTEILCSGLD